MRCLGPTVAHVPCLASCPLAVDATPPASPSILSTLSILFPATKARALVLPVFRLDHIDGEGGGLTDKGG
jgi:hypothetical protein